MVARTSLRTKLAEGLADQLTAIVADAVLTIQKADEPIDLYMVRLTYHLLSPPSALVKTRGLYDMLHST